MEESERQIEKSPFDHFIFREANELKYSMLNVFDCQITVQLTRWYSQDMYIRIEGNVARHMTLTSKNISETQFIGISNIYKIK